MHHIARVFGVNIAYDLVFTSSLGKRFRVIISPFELFRLLMLDWCNIRKCNITTMFKYIHFKLNRSFSLPRSITFCSVSACLCKQTNIDFESRMS